MSFTLQKCFLKQEHFLQAVEDWRLSCRSWVVIARQACSRRSRYRACGFHVHASCVVARFKCAESCTLQSSHWSCLLYLSESAVPFPTLPFLPSLLSCSQSSVEEGKEGWRSSPATVASPDLACGCRHLWLNNGSAALSLLPLEMNDVAPFAGVFCAACLCFVSSSAPLVTVDVLLSDWSGTSNHQSCALHHLLYRLMVFVSYCANNDERMTSFKGQFWPYLDILLNHLRASPFMPSLFDLYFMTRQCSSFLYSADLKVDISNTRSALLLFIAELPPSPSSSCRSSGCTGVFELCCSKTTEYLSSAILFADFIHN